MNDDLFLSCIICASPGIYKKATFIELKFSLKYDPGLNFVLTDINKILGQFIEKIFGGAVKMKVKKAIYIIVYFLTVIRYQLIGINY